MPSPIEAVQTAVASYEPYLRKDGHLIDPVIGQPTQYSAPYHALCQAVLALKGDPVWCGWCGLLRVDLAGALERVGYRVAIVKQQTDS